MTDQPRPTPPESPDDEALHPAYQQVREVLRSSLHEPAPAPNHVREAALAAALSEAPAALGTTTPSLTARRSLRLTGQQRLVGAAAGLLFLFSLGYVARNIGDTSGQASSAARDSASTALDASTRTGTQTAEVQPTMAPGAALGTQPESPGATATGVSAAAKALSAVQSASDLLAVPDQFTGDQPLVSGTGTATPNIASGVARPDTGCTLDPAEVVVAEVLFQGIDTWVVRNSATGTVRAIALDCHEVAHAP